MILTLCHLSRILHISIPLSLLQPFSTHPKNFIGTTDIYIYIFIGWVRIATVTQVTLCKQFGMIFALIILALLYAKFVMPAVLFFASKSTSKKRYPKKKVKGGVYRNQIRFPLKHHLSIVLNSNT